MKAQTIPESIYRRIARLVCQNQNCVKAGNTEWEAKSREELGYIAQNLLPSGSGIDCGTKIDLAENRAKERCDYIRKHRSQFEFRDFQDLIGCVRGKYFSGYASELCN